MFVMKKKVILMILDGWGNSPDPLVSAIDNANTDYIDNLYSKYPYATLRTDGLHVGLPEGQMGNSEVGHMNLGAGRIVYQDLAKINISIQKNSFINEKTIVETFNFAKSNNKKIHFLGLVSDGGVHSHTRHLLISQKSIMSSPIFMGLLTEEMLIQSQEKITYLI